MNRDDLNCKHSNDYYKTQETLPLDCSCGCDETEEFDEHYEEYGRCEYKLRCKGCGTYLGSYVYGHWDY